MPESLRGRWAGASLRRHFSIEILVLLAMPSQGRAGPPSIISLLCAFASLGESLTKSLHKILPRLCRLRRRNQRHVSEQPALLDRFGHARRNHRLPSRIAFFDSVQHVAGKDMEYVRVEAHDGVDVMILQQMRLKIAQVFDHL